MYIGLHVIYPLFLSDFKETWTFLTYFQKVLKYQIFPKIRRVAAESFHAEWRTNKGTYMTKLIVAFRLL